LEMLIETLFVSLHSATAVAQEAGRMKGLMVPVNAKAVAVASTERSRCRGR